MTSDVAWDVALTEAEEDALESIRNSYRSGRWLETIELNETPSPAEYIGMLLKIIEAQQNRIDELGDKVRALWTEYE